MPDKLTDNEIIKALEEHYKKVDSGYSCYLENGGKGDDEEEKYLYMVRDVLDLINRLQAENERLKGEVAKEFTCFVGDPHKVEHCPYLEELKTAKAEAYKECIEKVKENSNKTELVCSGALVRTDYTITEEALDNLLKEKEEK